MPAVWLRGLWSTVAFVSWRCVSIANVCVCEHRSSASLDVVMSLGVSAFSHLHGDDEDIPQKAKRSLLRNIELEAACFG